MGRKSTSSRAQTTTNTTNVKTDTRNYDGTATDQGIVIQGSSNVTLTDREAVADAFEFSEGVLLKAGDFVIDVIGATSARDEKFIAGLAEQVTNATSASAATANSTEKLINFGSIAVIAGAIAWAIRK